MTRIFGKKPASGGEGETLRCCEFGPSKTWSKAEHRKRPGETGKNTRKCNIDTAPEIFGGKGGNDKHRSKGLALSACPISILQLSREILNFTKIKE